MKSQLSVVLAVYNEERYLKQCLDSIKAIADEIVIVDGGSTDTTLEIAKQYTDTIIITDNPPIFHLNKQKALDAATNEWILQLDADEVVTQELAKEIEEIIQNNHTLHGYYIPRKNNFWGHFMKKTGVYPDYVIRLIRQGKSYFPCKSVHEQIVVEGKIGYLKQPLLHYSYESFSDYWRKANHYTLLTSEELKQKKIPHNITSFFQYMFVYPLQTFFTLFFRNQGFVDGIYGLLFSFFSALHHPIAYWKYINMKTV